MPKFAEQSYQPKLPGFCHLSGAIEEIATADREGRGAVYTRKEVVEFILDLAGYSVDEPLHHRRLLEPSFGRGDFLLPAVERLLYAYRKADGRNIVNDLEHAICAIEIHKDSFNQTKKNLKSLLLQNLVIEADADTLCGRWLVRDDFLLSDIHGTFTHVVGNPPYLRQESIPQVLIEEYRRRYTTIYDRADLYIPFIERSLRLLASGGVVGFICADRWMKNRYGGPLRRFVADYFHLRTYVDMVGTEAFQSDVVAYPAIFVIGKEKGTFTRLAHRPEIERASLFALAKSMTSDVTTSTNVKQVKIVTDGSEPWLIEEMDHLDIVRRLEAHFPTLEEAGCKVGIGVATGADKAFIGDYEDLDVEQDRKLPLVLTRDILTGTITWRGLGVINPFADTGGLVDLEKYPRLKRYLDNHKAEIAERHVAKKMPNNWYRTIDRIYPDLVEKPKLLIPDIKGEAHIVYDEGNFYPHHNLYFITSDVWDLQALQAVLLSGVAKLFVATYSTKMRGGYLRFQAQYLRRIRLPLWENVSPQLREKLKQAGTSRDITACNRAVVSLYGLSDNELGFLSAEAA